MIKTQCRGVADPQGDLTPAGLLDRLAAVWLSRNLSKLTFGMSNKR